jgi:sugar phosphate isomerase/epimerase
MENQDKVFGQISRRKFLGSSTALAAVALFPPGLSGCLQAGSRINSKIGGVQIGAISYSFRSMPVGARDILNYLKQIGLSSVELMGDSIEQFAGAPQYQGPTAQRGVQLTENQKSEMSAARTKYTEELRKWRLSASMEKFKELRKLYNNEGVKIDISKLGNPNWTDDEIDYAFTVAKTLGARGITFEISTDAAKRMAPFADKHKLYAIMHNHLQPGQPGFSFEDHLAYGKNLMLNFDVGHYYGATGLNPNGIIEKLHDRIASLHIKDKTGPDSNPANTNMPFGKGETPLADILLLLKKNRWPITADIELEYPIPEGSDAVTEVKKCLEYCRAVLVT